MPNSIQLNVFISSTCYDLADVRFELKSFLEREGFVVRLSEDPTSAFYVDPSADSIGSCLANVEASDVVVCIIDRRYGPSLGDGHNDQSATEAEVRHARAKTKPVFFFVRDVAFAEYGQLRANEQFKPRWIEQGKPEMQAKYKAFLDYASRLPEHANRSNWCGQFRSVVELKPLVLKRIGDHFPQHRIGLALHPERFIRLVFHPKAASDKDVFGTFKNVGHGSAIELRYGWAAASLEESQLPMLLGGLREGDELPTSFAGKREERLGVRFPVGNTELYNTSRRAPACR